MSNPKKQNPYLTPHHIKESTPDEKSASVFWMVPGGAVGAIIGANIIQRPDELLNGKSLAELIFVLTFWGFIGLVGSMVWRVPRHFLFGRLKTTAIARFVSGVNILVLNVLVLQCGRTQIINLPEPAMGFTMISLMAVCVVVSVEFEAWFGRRVQ